MYGWFNLRDKIRNLFYFTKQELEDIIVLSLLIGLLFGFNKWGSKSLNVYVGLFNTFNFTLIGLVSILFHLFIQKIYALKLGLKLSYKLWKPGVFISLLFIFLTNGNLIVFFPSALLIELLQGHRLGFFRYGLNLYTVAFINFSGVLSHIFLGILFKYLYSITNNLIFYHFYLVNAYFVVMLMIPLDAILAFFSRIYTLNEIRKDNFRLEGTLFIFGSRKLYAFTIGLIIAFLMLKDISIFDFIIFSFLLGFISLIAYLKYEKEI